ncbi:SWIM zinc finger family protein [Paenibacillus sp. JTLBN-2024]
MESECDCPYDFGPVCKHQVAVFLELKNREADGASSPSLSGNCWKTESKQNNRIAALDCIGFIYRGRAH